MVVGGAIEKLHSPFIGTLRLRGNNTLTTVDHLEGIESVSGFFDIIQNPVLLTRQKNLWRRSGSKCHIQGASLIENPKGIRRRPRHGYTETAGDLVILSTELIELTGLTKRKSIGGYLRTGENDHLQDLRGLENIQPTGANLHIHSNPTLPTYLAQDLGARVDEENVKEIIVIDKNDDEARCD